MNKKRANYDAHATAKPGEPTFTLQGGDPLAPKTLMFYADQVRSEARKAGNARGVRAGLQRAAACEEIAWSFEDFQKDVAPEEVKRPALNDKAKLAAGAKDAVARRSALIVATGHLSNARSTAEEAREITERFGMTEETLLIAEAQRILQKVQDAIDPST